MSNQIDFKCFDLVKQEFLICVTVRKASNLIVLNADTYVKITLDKKVKYTNIFKQSSNPYYNEYYVFELQCSVVQLLHKKISFEIKQQTHCKKDINVGELLIDLRTVWNQSGHLLYKKWGKLECPYGKRSDIPRGYLQIDLTIISRNYTPKPSSISMDKEIKIDFDDIEKNLLEVTNENNLKNVKFNICIYNGVFQVKGDYYVEVSFSGINSKTNVSKNNALPEWNEEFEMVARLPSPTKLFQFKVMSSRKTIGEHHIYIGDMIFDDYLPSFGPSFINLYNTDNIKTYIGRIIISIRCENLKQEAQKRIMHKRQIRSINEITWSKEETFIIECLILQGDFIHSSKNDTIELKMSFAEKSSGSLMLNLQSYSSIKDLKYYFGNKLKSLKIEIQWPDCRSKYEADYFIYDFLREMKNQLEYFRILQMKHFDDYIEQAKNLRILISNIIIYYSKNQGKNHLHYHGAINLLTDWDKNRLNCLEIFFDNLIKEFEGIQLKLDTVTTKEQTKMAKNEKPKETIDQYKINEIVLQIQLKIKELNKLVDSRIQDVWPNLILSLNIEQKKSIAMAILDSKNFIHTEQMDKDQHLTKQTSCHQILFKPIDCQHTCTECGCIYAKFNSFVWIGTKEEYNKRNIDKDQWKTNINSLEYICNKTITAICKIYLYQGKIRPGYDRTGLCDAKIRYSIFNKIYETDVIYESLSPIWNEIITIYGIKLMGSLKFYEPKDSLKLAFEIFDEDDGGIFEYIGCGLIPINFRTNNVQNISLKWFSTFLNGSHTTDILMACELIEDLEEKYVTKAIEVVKNLPKEICPAITRYKIEVIFVGLRNMQRIPLCKFRQNDDLKVVILFGSIQLESQLNHINFGKNLNFLNVFASGIVYLAEQTEYWPPIVIKYIRNKKPISSTMISNSSKYFLKEQILDDESDDITENKIFNKKRLSQILKGDKKNQKSPEEKTPLLNIASVKENLKKQFTFDQIKHNLNALTNTEKLLKYKPKLIKKSDIDISDYTWWTKFYYSQNKSNQDLSKPNQENSKHFLIIYQSELEEQMGFEGFQDWAEKINLITGLKNKKNEQIKEEIYCNLKCNIKIRNFDKNVPSGNHLKIPKNDLHNSCKIIVRIYIVQGLGLRSGNSPNPFIIIKLGTKIIYDRSNYISNQSSPIFGKRYDLEALLPTNNILSISVYDRGTIKDTLIGTTNIDLEDRYRTKFRARVGIPNEYDRVGYNAWRNIKLPTKILKEICIENDLPAPLYSPNDVTIGDIKFENLEILKNDPDSEEKLGLLALKNLHKIPQLGFNLVPEHVETRSLFNENRPGIEQGKLQLWIELYDYENVPEPIDITPTPTQNYELRVIIFNTDSVKMDERNIFGTRMSDIFVKCWLDNIEQFQRTDVHYRSLTGTGNFNWRMIFPFKYCKNEEMMVITKKKRFQDSTDIKLPPIFHIQIWDSDTFSANDFLGSLEINLTNFVEPSQSKRNCNLNNFNKKNINLFKIEKIKGWFPCTGTKDSNSNQLILTGKVELQLEILMDKEAELDPVGLGRNPPNPLPEPKRPKTSFNPLKHPLKSFKLIILPFFKKCCCYLLLFFAIILICYKIIF